MIRDDDALTYQSTRRGPPRTKYRCSLDRRRALPPPVPLLAAPHGRPVPCPREPVRYGVLPTACVAACCGPVVAPHAVLVRRGEHVVVGNGPAQRKFRARRPDPYRACRQQQEPSPTLTLYACVPLRVRAQLTDQSLSVAVYCFFVRLTPKQMASRQQICFWELVYFSLR